MSTDAWEAVIGIEIHAQLLTRTKMFCGCTLSFGDPPNTHTCPVCLAHPGALPVVNREAIRLAIIAGHALGCEIAERSVFARKNYFYPDLPKAYQISQYDQPICGPGRFRFLTEDGAKTLGITRAHLEEDAAKLIHLGGEGRRANAEGSVVDFNRGGTPLLEIVTEPELHNGADAAAFLKQLRQTLVHLRITDGSMEQGSLRADANISVRPAGSTELGTKTELKNMNSFTFLERGIAAEIERQIAILDVGGTITQETLHYEPATGQITSLRSKEEAHDYRYFPEPDLEPVVPDRAMGRRTPRRASGAADRPTRAMDSRLRAHLRGRRGALRADRARRLLRAGRHACAAEVGRQLGARRAAGPVARARSGAVGECGSAGGPGVADRDGRIADDFDAERQGRARPCG